MPRKPQFGSIYQPVKKGGVKTAVWWIRYYVNGVQQYESSKSKRYADAEKLLKERQSEIQTGLYAGPVAEKIRVSTLLDDLIQDFETNGKSVEWVRHVDKHLRPFFGELYASRLTTDQIRAYIKQRREEKISNSTINRELNRLKRALNLGRFSTPPKVKRLPIFPKLEEPAARKGFFEHEEFMALREELPEHLRAPLTFAYYTGCRRGEILALEWPQVDLDRRVVRLNAGETKSGEGRLLPLVSELFHVLSIQRETRDQGWPKCPWVFFRYGKRIKDFRGAWEEASKRAATREKSPVPSLWAGKKPTKLFHDLRRTGARNLVRAGVPERVVMQIGGWKTRSVFDRYNIVSERDLVEAAGKLERHLAEVESERAKATLRQLPGIAKNDPP
jgi:integrase